MKILIFPTKAVTGKGKFQDRLALELHNQGVAVTRNVTDAVDIALHVGRIRTHANAKKNVLRVGPACVDSSKDYKKINGEKWKSVKRADAVIYQSEYSMKVYRKFVGKPDCPEGIIFNGADPEFYKKLQPAISHHKYNFLAAQRKWIPQARLKGIVKSFLSADIPDSTLWIAGNVEKRYAGKDVIYLGLLHDIALGRMYKLCNAMIHMVYLDACSNSVAEALVAGCPVICGNQGGNIELVLQGITDKPYNFKPINLNKPPKINREFLSRMFHVNHCNKFERYNADHLHISNIAQQYKDFFKGVLNV
jgi:glycosyltransferase involved in cell wall biosynthesis